MAKSSKSVLYQNLAGESLVIDTKSSSYRDVILQKVKLKYTEAVPSFSKRIEQRFAVDKLVSGQCRICGLKEKSCCKIFETDETLSKLVNTYMPITVSISFFRSSTYGPQEKGFPLFQWPGLISQLVDAWVWKSSHLLKVYCCSIRHCNAMYCLIKIVLHLILLYIFLLT